MNRFKKQLIQLLTIQAPSGKEKKVSDFLYPILEKEMDAVFLDEYENLLAEKIVGDGKGATILLSAHMDTVSNIQKGRQIIEVEDGVLQSSKGVLGADDRAGIAIILAVLRNIDKTSFNGKIKVAFSREEEIGCVGSDQIRYKWLKDVNLAIVVDRKGNRDIVVNCGGYQPFCDPMVGDFFENVAAMANMEDWKAVNGGVSDAYTFSGLGINSVNLSAGYYNEHTSLETVHIAQCRDTITLILQAFSVVNTFYQAWGEVPAVKKSNYKSYDSTKSYKGSENDYQGDGYGVYSNYDYGQEEIFYEEDSRYGAVSGSNVAGYVYIMQEDSKNGTQEIIISEDEFEKMITEYYANRYGTQSNQTL